jgi:hypothetical protein
MEECGSMKRLLMATTLMLMTTTVSTWAQVPAEHDSHHPAESAAPPAPTAGGMPVMNMMRMMGMSGPGMGTIDRIEGRIAFLRAELKITDAQAGAWNTFADALRTNAKKLGAVRASMLSGPGQQQPSTLANRLDLQERWLLARLEGVRAIKPAFANLYATFSDDQKKTADEILAPHIGVMPVMSGQMHEPGRPMPGPMMR